MKRGIANPQELRRDYKDRTCRLPRDRPLSQSLMTHLATTQLPSIKPVVSAPFSPTQSLVEPAVLSEPSGPALAVSSPPAASTASNKCPTDDQNSLLLAHATLNSCCTHHAGVNKSHRDPASAPAILPEPTSASQVASGAILAGSLDNGGEPMDVNADSRAHDAIPAPTWMCDVNMSKYLCDVSKEGAWQKLIDTLFLFKAINTATGKLPTTSRPDEVASWIKSKKKDTPREVNPDSYGSSFMAWWIAIQPDWRLNDDTSFNYVVPATEDWRQLHKGGSAGLYTIVVALSWWIKALSAETNSSRAWSAVRDVQWVVDQIYKKVKPVPQTHAGCVSHYIPFLLCNPVT
ncbi:uncharacterized protein LACBIDRAFT_326631 [Laccaria bicolor S238N-H82]|uniref:Predicted protein n=1 Tax=Laccaria bicolor (strain S238N-H82 / ATCC MYA-4686) TaxID=486041 RepID=B0D9A2_LACBS|nr:uncharacterized protein LACBIDRAFT_326631 [Laccaria bicolor S238N-H82]EDR08980.1 predicted protein [Laccaria bicolor S238N-H82]|eukprot:XP_001880293.1 predicted protein [Laccaria bicolor S238N-H82]